MIKIHNRPELQKKKNGRTEKQINYSVKYKASYNFLLKFFLSSFVFIFIFSGPICFYFLGFIFHEFESSPSLKGCELLSKKTGFKTCSSKF